MVGMDYDVESSEFYGVLKSVKYVTAILRSINIRHVCTVFIHEDGFTIVVEQPRIAKAVVYIKSHLFYVYNVKDEACFAPFGLVLDAFIDCMRLTVPVTTFSPSTINAVDTNFDYCEIIYNGMGSAFQLRRTVKEQSQKIECELLPFAPEEEGSSLTFSESTQGSSQRILIKSSWLKSVFEDLSSSAEQLFITIGPGATALQIIEEGPEKTDENNLPSNGDEVLAVVSDRQITFSYIYQHILFCKKTLAISTEVLLEIYEDGAIRMTFKVSNQGQQAVSLQDYVEYSFLPSTSFT